MKWKRLTLPLCLLGLSAGCAGSARDVPMLGQAAPPESPKGVDSAASEHAHPLGPDGPPEPDEPGRIRLVSAADEAETDAPSDGASAPAGPQSLEEYLETALRQNPEILAARREAAALAERVPQVTALDDPTLSQVIFPFENHSLQTAAGRAPYSLMLSQKFPWFGTLRLRGEVADEELRMALSRLAAVELQVFEQVQRAYYRIAYLQRAIEITEENRDVLREIRENAQDRYRTEPQVTLRDVLRADVELAEVENRLVELQQQLQQSQADLAELLAVPPETEFLAAEVLNLPPVPRKADELYEAALQCRPELHERLHAIRQARREVELAELDFYPDVTVGAGWQAITSDDAVSPVANGRDNVNLTVGMNLPIYRDKLRAGVRERQERLAESARRYDAERDETFREIRRLVVQARTLQEQIGLFEETIIPTARETLEAARINFRAGDVSFQDLLEDWAQLLRFRLQSARLKSNLGQTLAALERTVGCDLEALPDLQPAPLLDDR